MILSHPLGVIEWPQYPNYVNNSYSRVFPKYMTNLNYTPELAYYNSMAELTPLQMTVSDTWKWMNTDML
jgi:hypothetical protein